MGYVENVDEDELFLLRRLQAAQQSRLCPTFGRGKTAALLKSVVVTRTPYGDGVGS